MKVTHPILKTLSVSILAFASFPSLVLAMCMKLPPPKVVEFTIQSCSSKKDYLSKMGRKNSDFYPGSVIEISVSASREVDQQVDLQTVRLASQKGETLKVYWESDCKTLDQKGKFRGGILHDCCDGGSCDAGIGIYF